MQNGVFNACDVLVDGKPVIGDLRIEGGAVIVRVGVAVEIPGGIDKGVHGVGLAACRTATVRASRVGEFRNSAQR